MHLPEAVQKQVERLTARLVAVLGERCAIVLHGSLALGEFRTGQSDLDVLVIVTAPWTMQQARALAELLLAESLQPAPIELSVLSHEVLTAWRHPAPYLFHYSEDWRDRTIQLLADPATDWLAVHTDPDLTVHVVVARQAGIVLHGSVDWPVPSRADALAAVWYDIATAEADVVTNPISVVLNLCRTIWWLEHGVVLSKSAGGVEVLSSLTDDAHLVVTAVLGARATRQDVQISPETLRAVAGELLARVKAFGERRGG